MAEITFGWSEQELAFLQSLCDPVKIQEFLDTLEYDADLACRSPRWVMREKKAHCFEGALFAAAALQLIGYPPLLVDLRAENDDDHVIAVFKKNGHWGAIAKSNFTTLRFREPVYRSLRELAMSYFDFYFNILGDKSLRAYSLPLNLTRFNDRNWMTTDEDLEYIGDYLDRMRHFPLVDSGVIASLRKADERLLQASLLGANEAGLYKPKIR